MSDDLDSGNPEGVSRNDPTLPLFFNPAFAQVFEGRGDEPLDKPGTQPAVTQAPAAAAAAPEDEGEPPQGVPFPQFPGRGGAPAGAAQAGSAPEPVAAGEGGEPVAAPDPALLLGQIQAQQAAIADVLQSTVRAVASLAERMGSEPQPAPTPQAPAPPDPSVVRLAERLGVDADEFIAAVSSVSGAQVAGFARALDENIRMAEQAQREFLTAMKKEDPQFDKAAWDAYLMADADAARLVQSAQDKVAAGRIVWRYAKGAEMPQPQGQVQAEPQAPAGATAQAAAAAAAPVKGARAGSAPGAKGTRVPQQTEGEQQAARLAKLEEKSRDLGDEHPLSRNYFLARIFGSADERDFIDPRVARHGRMARPRAQS